MTTRTPNDEFDMVVVGAGLTGLLVSLGLQAGGKRVLLLEKGTVGRRQSSASHGYLHKGFAYGSAEEGISIALNHAQNYWDYLSPVTLSTSNAFAVFSGEAAAARSAADWQSQGLRFERAQSPKVLREGACAFHTYERTINTGNLLTSLRQEVVGLGVLVREHVAVTYIETNRTKVTLHLLADDGEAATIAANQVVLASGAGRVLGTGLGTPHPVETRRSYMAVFRGDLPNLSLIFPESEKYGLFIAPRRISGTTYWLVSDFHSFAPLRQRNEGLGRWWTEHITRTLDTAIDPAIMASLEFVGTYSELKSGLRPVRGTVSADSVVSLRANSIVLAAPSKLTLAPLAAEQAINAILKPEKGKPTRTSTLLQHLKSTPRAEPEDKFIPERWQLLSHV